MFIDHPEFRTMVKKVFKIFDYLSIGAFIAADRKVADLNHSAGLIMGVDKTSLADKTCQKLCCSIPCHGHCPLQGSPHSGEECPNYGEECPDLEIIDRHGSRHMVTRFVVPLFTPDRTVKGCFTVLQDHSALTELIQRVEHQERTLKMIFDAIDTGIFTVNKGGHLTFFNRAAEEITGYHRRQVLGKNCFKIFTGDDQICNALVNKTIRSGETLMNQTSRISSSVGEKIPVQTSFIPLKNEKNMIVGGLATLRDLTLVRQVSQMIEKNYSFYDMIGKAPVMQQIFEKASVVAATDATILIEGSTGTGKDMMAKVLHSASRRANQPFIKVNCAAIPDHLLESEMFGYVKGAFTGATQNKPGRFHEANHGTIFLDEIGDISFELQAKLLRVLEDREYYPLGSRHIEKVDVRIISATNRGLEALVKKKKFRKDLYYRLNVLCITLPNLVDRKADLPLLINHILRRLCTIKGYESPGIDEAAMALLLNYQYPGNVRELENILEHALIICQEKTITPEVLPPHLQQRTWNNPEFTLPDKNKLMSEAGKAEAERIIFFLKQFQGSKKKTATALGIDRTTLWRKMKRFDIHYH